MVFVQTPDRGGSGRAHHEALVASSTLYTPATPLVAVRVEFRRSAGRGSSANQFEVYKCPVVALCHQVEDRYSHPNFGAEHSPRTHEEFVSAGYQYIGQAVVTRCIYVASWGRVASDNVPGGLADDSDLDQSESLLVDEGMGFAGRIVSAADVETVIPSLKELARKRASGETK